MRNTTNEHWTVDCSGGTASGSHFTNTVGTTMIVINFFAGPGAGKSTCAAELFAEMKKSGFKVELVTEYAKDLVYEKALKNITQEKIFAEQHWRIERLKGHSLDYVITDSPILLSAVYKKDNDNWCRYVRDVFNQYKNFNVWVERPKYYMQYGRIQNKAEAQLLDLDILTELGEPDWTVKKDTFNIRHLMQAMDLVMRKKEREC